MRLGVVAWIAVGLALAALEGCVSYTGAVPETARKGALEVSIKQLRADPNRHVFVTMVVEDVPPEAVLVGATLGDGQPECRGTHAIRMGRERGRAADQPLVAGERISLELSGWTEPALGGTTPTLNLIVRTRENNVRCIPFALSRTPGEPITWEPDQRFTLGFDFGVDGFTAPLGSVRQTIYLPLTLGVNAGRFHFDIGAGVGGAGCHMDNCPVSDPEQAEIEYETSFPLLAGASVQLYEDRNGIALGTGLRYRAAYLTAETYAGHEGFWTHSVLLTPYFGLSAQVLGESGIGGSDIGLAALEIPVGYTFADNGESSFTIGAGLRFWLTVL